MENSTTLPSFREQLVDSQTLARKLGVRRETLSRLAGDPKRGFPKAVRLGLRKYYDPNAVREWIRHQTALAEQTNETNRRAAG